MSRSYQAVLFDVENVIAHPDEGEMARRLAALSPGLDPGRLQAVRDRPDLYPLWEAYSVGALAGEDYWAAVLGGLGLPVTSAGVAALRAAYAAGVWARRDEAVLAIARALAGAGYRLGLLSNSAPEHEGHVPAFVAGFDVALFSHRLGLRKPAAEAYLAAAAALGVAVEAVVFVDDKARNVGAAEALGMTGLLFTGAPALAADLVRLGLLPAVSVAEPA